MTRTILTAGILALMGCLSLGAQSIKLIATIPFDFRIGAHPMPAGDYTVSHNAGVLTVRRESDKPKTTMIQVFGASPSKGFNRATSKLVFNRYGEAYFLASVWQAGFDSGLAVPQSKVEKEIASHGRGSILTASARLQAK